MRKCFHRRRLVPILMKNENILGHVEMWTDPTAEQGRFGRVIDFALSTMFYIHSYSFSTLLI